MNVRDRGGGHKLGTIIRVIEERLVHTIQLG